MTQLTPVSQILSQFCDSEVEYRSYSGYGMNGKQCSAITGSFKSCMTAINWVIQTLHNEVVDAARDEDTCETTSYDLDDAFSVAVDDLMRFEFDSMGLDTVVYWPHIKFGAHEGN